MADDDVTIRAVFHEWERALTFEDIEDLLTGLQSLIWTAVVPTIASAEPTRGKVAGSIARGQVVRSISYNSPLEIVFTISASTGALAAAGTALLTLWDRYQTSRVKTAEAGAVVRGFDLIRDHMKVRAMGAAEAATLHEADRTLIRLESLERVEE